MPIRLNALSQWLETTISQPFTVHAITNDASFRRYFRVQQAENSFIAMDAPPDKEDCRPFIDIAQRLFACQLVVPQILAQDLKQGFLLLSDLGTQTYLPLLAQENTVHTLYQQAMQSLLVMQKQVNTQDLALYDSALLQREMLLFKEWLLITHLNLSLTTHEQQLLTDSFKLLEHSALQQPQVFVHRDYHSRNLMWFHQQTGILDFQDAVVGAVTYDLVSLLRDCYIKWSPSQVNEWVITYYQQAKTHSILPPTYTVTQFKRDFDLMGIQRHLKASGIFARLFRRDGKEVYLKDIPRTLSYIVEVGKLYPELTPLSQFVEQRVLPQCMP